VGALLEDRVVLVDANDVEVGTEEKLPAHAAGVLHRAFSVFISDAGGRMLLQRRAVAKYHSGGLWSNTCCSHPRPGESTAAAAARRLREEMGIVCPLEPAFRFIYRAELDHGLTEHEYDHVFVGRFAGVPKPDPAEVDAWRWAAPAQIAAELQERPGDFTAWFHLAFAQMSVRGLA
jgi:isopentenyl-diphosphate Delta-isomerase